MVDFLPYIPTDWSVYIIDNQYIGKLKGLKLDLDLSSGSLKTDIKSLKKAARQAIAPELMRRANKIIKTKDLKIEDDHKIYWMDNPIAQITVGKDYLNPNLKLLADDAMDLESYEKTKINLEQKLNFLIKTELSDLVKLSKLNFKNNYVRALSYQLFENNGVIKRESAKQFINNISKENRFE